MKRMYSGGSKGDESLPVYQTHNRRNSGHSTLFGSIMGNRALVFVVFALCIVASIYKYNESQTALIAKQSECAKFQQQSDSLSAQLQVVYEHKSRLEKTLETEKETCATAKHELQQQLKSVQEGADSIKQNQSELQEKYSSLQSQLNSLKDEKLEEENQKAEEIAQLNDNLKSSQIQYSQLAKTLETERASAQSLRAERDQLRSQIANFQAKLNQPNALPVLQQQNDPLQNQQQQRQQQIQEQPNIVQGQNAGVNLPYQQANQNAGVNLQNQQLNQNAGFQQEPQQLNNAQEKATVAANKQNLPYSQNQQPNMEATPVAIIPRGGRYSPPEDTKEKGPDESLGNEENAPLTKAHAEYNVDGRELHPSELEKAEEPRALQPPKGASHAEDEKLKGGEDEQDEGDDQLAKPLNVNEQREAAGERVPVFDREEQEEQQPEGGGHLGGARVLKQPEAQHNIPLPPKEDQDFVEDLIKDSNNKEKDKNVEQEEDDYDEKEEYAGPDQKWKQNEKENLV